MREITIVVYTAPDRALYPNNRLRSGGHWPGVAAAKAQRHTAWGDAINQKPTGWEPITGKVSMRVAFAYPKGRRLPDLDASISAAKAMIDGIVDAGILADDRLIVRHDGAEQTRLKGINADVYPDGYTEFTFTEVAA